jgi:1-deoxy-D-xylulose-5-phosphate synthase
MAEALRRLGGTGKVVAIIGDGAMTAGMAFEALNHAGEQGTDLLVVLNDNDMSISPNVGALSNYFAKVLSGKLYSTVREGSKRVLNHMPPIWEFARRAEEHVKGMIIPGTLFEELGFSYFGPIDGHDLKTLVATLRNLRPLEGPRLLHVVTKKGKGYAPAEANPVEYHAIGTPMDPKVGVVTSKSSSGPTYSQVFGEWLCDMAAMDERLVAITPAMREGSGLVKFEQLYPDRYFDVGIAEQHSVTLAAGLACEGLKPVVAIYSTFLQRADDQFVHDVVIQELPVLLAIDRAGVVGGDGPTHAGSYDISYLRCLPNVVVMTPADENECRQMLYTGFELDRPAAVRYPRGKGPGVAVEKEMKRIPLGKAELRRTGSHIAILAFGPMLDPALRVAEQIDATVVNMRFVKPLDDEMVLRMAEQHEVLVTVDENAVAGGAGSAVNECLMAHQVLIPVLNHGLPDRFVQHGTREEMLADAGLDAAGLLKAIEGFVGRHDRRATKSQPLASG